MNEIFPYSLLMLTQHIEHTSCALIYTIIKNKNIFIFFILKMFGECYNDIV